MARWGWLGAARCSLIATGSLYALVWCDDAAMCSILLFWSPLPPPLAPPPRAPPRFPQDKTNGYDFFYRQHVIKPALVGLAGPWISGGVEFNWCGHTKLTPSRAVTGPALPCCKST